MERVLVENCLFNPFIDHVSRLMCSDGSLDPTRVGDSTRRAPMKINRDIDRSPRRLMHQGDLCEGKFVSAIHCHPTFPGKINKKTISLHYSSKKI